MHGRIGHLFEGTNATSVSPSGIGRNNCSDAQLLGHGEREGGWHSECLSGHLKAYTCSGLSVLYNVAIKQPFGGTSLSFRWGNLPRWQTHEKMTRSLILFLLGANNRSSKCPCMIVLVSEAKTSGRDIRSGFSLGIWDITERMVVFPTPTIAGLLLCIPELRILCILPGLFLVFLTTVVTPPVQCPPWCTVPDY